MAVVGASGGVGQPLSLLLKLNSLVSHLALYDIAPFTHGVAVDLSHINTPCRVTCHKGEEELAEAIRCKSVIINLIEYTTYNHYLCAYVHII